MSRPYFSLLLGVSVLAGCSFDQEPPAQFYCTSERPECPAGQRCNTVLNRCIEAADSRVPDARGDGPAQDLAVREGGADLSPSDLVARESGSDGPGADLRPADASAPPFCGDQIKNGNEVCDDQDFGGATCAALGFDEGELSCTESCTIVASGCRNCTALTPPAGVTPTRIVDAASGNDATAFEDCLPFRTITAALAASASGDVVWVAPGLYNAALGETFPLTIPDGVTLVGNEAAKGGSGAGRTAIEGGRYTSTVACSPAVFFNSTSGRISGFQLKGLPYSSYSGCAIGGYRTTAVISNNTFLGEYWSIRIQEGQATGQHAQIVNNTFSVNVPHGILLQGASPKIRGNLFNQHTNSAVAIYTQGSTPSLPDLGFDHLTDKGENIFSAGKAIYHGSNVSIYALGNTWPNHQDPTCGSTGVIHVITASGKVYWGHLANQSCPP